MAVNDFRVITQTEHEDEHKARVRMIRDEDISCLICFCAVPHEEIVDLASKRGIPIVLIHRESNDSRLSTFVSDDYYGGRLVAKHFLNSGRNSIVYIYSEDKSDYPANVRYEGLADGVEEAGLKVQKVMLPRRLPIEERFAYVKCSVGICDAVFAYSDLEAKEFLEGAKYAGVSIPEQISVVGYNNSDLVLETNPNLSSVYWAIDKLCHLAIDCIERYVSGQFDAFPVNVRILPRLHIRDSSY
jgi:DNA-binding LacI/PurR family transcriptional regulator